MPSFRSQMEQAIRDLRKPRLAGFRQRANQLKEKYSPRKRFNRWRDSDVGIAWKGIEYHRVNRKCQGCGESFSISNLVIDHIQPLSKAPELATEISNFQLLCHACNQKKGAT